MSRSSTSAASVLAIVALVASAPTVQAQEGQAQNAAPSQATQDTIAGRSLRATATPREQAGARADTARRLSAVTVTAPRTVRAGYAATRSRSATKTDTPLRDTPQAATVLTSTLIADQAMQSMADVVRYIPGVGMAQGEGHRDAPIIRGNTSTADFFVDGVRDDAQYLRDLYNVERIEALKGSNAMIFGRGGGGGVINRVQKEASWLPVGAISFEGGSFDHNRATLDVGRPLSARAAARLDAVYERSGGFRNAADIRRQGVNPTATIITGAGTILHVSYEHFDDHRNVDRGIPSFLGAPSRTAITTFFGDPDVSRSRARVDAADVVVDRELGDGMALRNRTRVAAYDKFYQNVYPGALDSTGTQVNLLGYNNATTRTNLFNQTDLTGALVTGSVRHTLLAGTELSRQGTDNLRNTGYFGGNATSTPVPFAQPMRATGVVFRPSATDADNHVVADVAALYAQDQLALSSHWQAIVGMRVDRFAVSYHNNRVAQDLERNDKLVSPRAGLVFKPVDAASVYVSYSVSHLPSSGDQFSSLTATTQALEPERFRNYEIGAKWDVRESLALTGALFCLDRNNSSAPDPLDPSHTVQTGAQRSSGYELGVSGEVIPAWQIVGGWSAQNARIVNRTTAAPAGALVPLVPAYTASLWNRLQFAPLVGAGFGVIRQAKSFAAIDNAVTLPAFTRYDAALFAALPWRMRAQLNVENLLDSRYYGTSQGNNNIMPGASRTVRFSLTAGL